MTHSELIDWGIKLTHPTMATIITKTKPQLLKGAPSVFKMCRRQVLLGSIYQNAVNNQRGREDKDRDFLTMPRSWKGERYGCIRRYNEKYYLECQILKELGHIYYDQDIVSPDVIAQFLPKKSSRQGLQKEVIWRDYLLTNILVLNNDPIGDDSDALSGRETRKVRRALEKE